MRITLRNLIPQLLASTALLIVALLALWTFTSTSTFAQTKPTSPQQTAPTCDPNWMLVPSPNVATRINSILSLAVLSANDIWAVGYSQELSSSQRTMIQHWNGTGWNVVPSPNVGSNNHNALIEVSAVSPTDIWAVGYYSVSGITRNLALHWNGTAWTIVTTPNIGTLSNVLASVEVVSANDVWALGAYNVSSTVTQNLALHWNGTAWAVVTTPNASALSNLLYGITAISADDIWAVGYYSFNSSLIRSLAMHWDGTAWTIVNTPNLGTGSNILYSVDAVATNNIWAVGSYNSGGVYLPYAMWWNGTTWNLISTPSVPGNAQFWDVKAISANDVWAVGYYSINSVHYGLLEHWNGTNWTEVESAEIGVRHEFLAVAAVSSSDVWAAGRQDPSETATLVEHYNPCTGSPTPTVTPGGQPSPTPPACSISFTDVPSGSTFYDYVRCMACRNIIGGYTSGCETGNPCFRPTSNVTRGQLSKIVANAANFTEPAGIQQFEDVPPGTTFYDFVWRLASRSYVGGYACGGPSEPCNSPNNLPYFRPNGNASRGQIAKIVANSANLSDPPGPQLFEDVPPSHTFYDYIQRLANPGIIGGYACGGPSEPCNPPNNLPYFRPSNNATRGQTAKIVSNTFFPNCSTLNK